MYGVLRMYHTYCMCVCFTRSHHRYEILASTLYVVNQLLNNVFVRFCMLEAKASWGFSKL